MRNIVTITGIRPDFIRMSEIFKKLDKDFNHTLIHTGQHFDSLLSDVFFNELEIRKPDINLGIGKGSSNHFEQLANTCKGLQDNIDILRAAELVMFLGDSNSALAAIPLKKEGIKIGHIEAGMRSYDKRMFEEINRVACDHCSDYHFVYHKHYKYHLTSEGLNSKNIHIVGNTIVEVANKIKFDRPKRLNKILLDIHRPENFNYQHRMKNIIDFANSCSHKYNLPVYVLSFKRTIDKLKEYRIPLGSVIPINLMSFKNYIEAVYDSRFIISDSGTAQEEPALFRTPVFVPRDYTERPESVDNFCSSMVGVETYNKAYLQAQVDSFLDCYEEKVDPSWLGDGTTSNQIVQILKTL